MDLLRWGILSQTTSLNTHPGSMARGIVFYLQNDQKVKYLRWFA